MNFRKLAVFLAVLTSLSAMPRLAWPTVNNTVVSTNDTGDGATTIFTITFDFRDTSWITASVGGTALSQGTGANQFQVTKSDGTSCAVASGGPGTCTSVKFGTAPGNGVAVVIARSIPLTQGVVFNPASIFPYSGLSSLVDQMTLELQNLNAGIGGSSGSGGSSSSGDLPVGVAYNLLGWNSSGASVVNYGGGSLASGDVLQFNGSGWSPYHLTQTNLMSTLNSSPNTPLAAASGGSGVSNVANMTWGSNPITWVTTGTTSLTLPTSGTLLSGAADNNNTANTIVKRDSSGNFSANQITANNFVGPVTGAVTGNVTGNITGTATNVTGTVAIGNGGTGQTSRQAAINALLNGVAQPDGYFARWNGSNVTLDVLKIQDVPQGFSRQKLAQDTANTIVTNDGSGNMSVLTGGLAGNVPIFDGVKWAVGPQGTGIPGIFPYGADTGAADAYVVLTPSPPVLSYAPGVGISFLAGNSNTGAATINVQGLGVQSIKRADGADLNAGDIIANQMAILEYDGTNFQLINPYEPEKMNASTFAASATGNTTTTQFIANCSSACALTLPLISTIKKTVPVYFKSINTGVVTINASGSDTIDGASSAVVNFQWTALQLNPTSSGWVIQ